MQAIERQSRTIGIGLFFGAGRNWIDHLNPAFSSDEQAGSRDQQYRRKTPFQSRR